MKSKISRQTVSFLPALLLLSTTLALSAKEPPPPGGEVSKSPFAKQPVGSYSSNRPDGSVPLWGELPLNDFGPVGFPFKRDGIRKLRPVPTAGVHPRILTTPDDLPDLRDRLKTTRCGQEIWKNVQCWSRLMRGNYDDMADYAQPDLMKGNWRGVHGRIPALYFHEADNAFNPKNRCFDRLVAGDTKGFIPMGWSWTISKKMTRCITMTGRC